MAGHGHDPLHDRNVRYPAAVSTRAAPADRRPRLPADRTGSDGRAATKADRRSQLLDAAAWLVTEKGVAGFTMEGLADAAGVSKALPYRHFSNANDALVALMNREVGRLGRAMVTACDGLDDGDIMIAAAIHAYFDTIADRGGLLNSLAGPGSPVPEFAGEGTRPAPAFLVELLRNGYDLTGQPATLAAWLITGLAIAGSDSWARGDGTREIIEPVTTAAIVSTIHAIIQTAH